MHRAWLIALIGLAASALPPRAASAEETPPPIEIGLAPHAGMAFGDACSQHGDVSECTNGVLFAGVQVAPRWRLAHLLSIGAVASLATGEGAGDVSTTWWRAEAEARLHPFEPSSPDLAFGVDAGMIAVFDRGTQARSATHLAPALGASCTLDFAITPAFALGTELRLFSWLFHDDLSPAGDSLALYGTQLGFSLGVTGTIRAGD